jgi:hypothetical protein
MRRGIVENILPPLVETRSLPPQPPHSGSILFQAFQPQRGSISSTEGSRILSPQTEEGAEAETEESVLSDDYDVMLKFLEEMEETDDDVEEDGLPERSKEFTADGGGGYNFNRYSRPPLADLPATVAAFFPGATTTRRRNDQRPGDSRFPYPYLVPPPEPHQRDPLQIGAQLMFQQNFAGGSGLVDVPGRRQQQQAGKLVGQLAGQLAGQLESADRPLAPAFKTIDVDREAGYDTHLAAHSSHHLNIIPDRVQDTERYGGGGGAEKGKQSAGSKGGGESSRDPGTRKAALTLAQLSSRLSAPPPPPVSGLSSSKESSAAAAPVREERVLAFLLNSQKNIFTKSSN